MPMFQNDLPVFADAIIYDVLVVEIGVLSMRMNLLSCKQNPFQLYPK